jgi:hypothetical protein
LLYLCKMKMLLKPILIYFLLINYCFAICLNSTNGFSSEINSTNCTTQNQLYYFTNSKLNLLGFIIKNEKSINSLIKLPNTFEKKQQPDSINDEHSRESWILSTFSNYILRERYTSKFFTSTDIIFPFHNFW